MRREEGISHPVWLTGVRLALFVVLPLVYFSFFLDADWLAIALVLLICLLVFNFTGRVRMRRSNRSLGFVWTLPWERTPNQNLLNWASTLIITPAIMLFPLTMLFFYDPLWPFRDSESLILFLVFYAGPWSFVAFIVYRHFKIGPETSNEIEKQ